MPPIAPEVREECLRLRREERLSLNEIRARTGVSKGSLSALLRGAPLPAGELAARQAARPRPPRARTVDWKDRAPSKLMAQPDVLELTPTRKARIAEAHVKGRLVARGFEIYEASFDSQKLDMVVESEATGSLFKIQVRHLADERRGMPSVPLRCSAGRGRQRRYERREFDLLVGYDAFSDTAFVYTAEEVRDRGRCVSACGEAHEAWHKLAALDGLRAAPQDGGAVRTNTISTVPSGAARGLPGSRTASKR